MKVDLHIGPHRTATTWIQWAAYRNRDALADRGVLFINEPAQSNGIARALIDLRADLALREFDNLLDAARERSGARHPEPRVLHSSEVFFEARRRREDDYEDTFRTFIEQLQGRGHEVRLVFVERKLEDLIVSNALLQMSLGNLQYLSVDLGAFERYVDAFQWLKTFYFEGFDVVHLSFDHLVREGDVFLNFMQLLYGLDLAGAAQAVEGVDARNTVTDEQVARGLLLAPIINWVELFGSVSRFEMFNANPRLQAPVSDESFAYMVARIPLIRDCMKAMARRAVDRYLGADGQG